ncbi:LysR family transcriptional regulator [Bordetella genomosp. 2]|uniref:LysR family transcriptional regulator n=1 Tax=Bordetella genomosp. 2 TaxID=1983456 RepID=A0A261W0V2_9BORD|nr:LysR family transcriptional regulator [Bordetella genomosp. 2]OZI79955.1 LysR family transcriptional regulator [Bordetella genomosp. 2]
MELRQLEAFAAVMSTGSVTAAGRLLGRSQPAITRLIQELEAEIGYALFTRNGPRVTPTEQGFLLYDDVERALVNLQQIRNRAEEIARGDARPLRLAATSALSTGLLPAALKRIEAHTATSHIHIRSASPERVLHDVLTGAAQLGATSLPLEHRGLTVHWIGQAPCVVALPADDPLAAQATVPAEALADLRLITMANPYRLRRRLDQALADRGGKRPGLIETNSSVNALAAVRAGLGAAVLEPVTAYGAPLEGVAIRLLDVEIPFFFGVITPQSQPPLPAVLATAEALAEAAAELLPGFVRHAASEHAALLQSIYGEATPLSDSAS